MRFLALTVLTLLAPSSAWAWQGAPQPAPLPPAFSLLVGVGNNTGGLGGQGQAYLADGRIGIFGGLGYQPELQTGDWSGVSVAGGVRAYTNTRKHRGYLEVSASPMQIELGCFAACERFYGLGTQAGYQLLTSGGFTLAVAVGVGYTLGLPDGSSRASLLSDLSLGYTWRR
jgi:hypothetical protein